MIKKYGRPLGHAALILLLVILLLVVSRSSRKTDPAVCAPLTFTGEYSQNGEAWQPLAEDDIPSAISGPLVLRGRFDREIREGEVLNLLLDHQEYCLYVNGQLISASPAWNWDLTPGTCGRVWHSVSMPAVTAQDTVELHLYSHHRFTGAPAYKTLLNSLYLGERLTLRDTLSARTAPLWWMGVLVAILSIGIMAVALAFSLARLSGSQQMWSLGLVSFCMGVYICLSLPDAPLLEHTPFVTTGMMLCLLLGALEISSFLSKVLSGRRRKIATLALYVQGLFAAGAALVCLPGRVLLYDLMLPWGLLQTVLCPVLLVCCLHERHICGKLRSPALPVACLMLLCAIAELAGCLFTAFPHGMILKPAFLLLFVLLLGRGAHYITTNHQKAGQAEQLANELENSRILMAMNQIRTHFIFNVLNAISGMCKYDPEKADRTVVLFARFLRTNIDIMQSDVPVTFHTALRHAEDYVALEQVRFGDRLHFVTDIEEDFFCLPPLVLQPLIENAIKHGLTPKSDGGTITLRTRVDGNDVCVSVHDDGVGYDTTLPVRAEAVGLQNVRFRLQHTMNGTLTMESVPGKGTTATIRIPLEEATKCM